MEEATYAFDNARPGQGERLRALEQLLDAGTIAQLEARGVDRGWRCLEVGAGGGSIADWLSERVGPEGSVVATDLDTTVLDGLSSPNVEVRRHDVLADELPEDEFDLVHMRLLLAWLSEPRAALRRMAASLRPGGWLVAEEMDFVSAVPDPRMDEEDCLLVRRLIDAHSAALAQRSDFDPFFGRRLEGELAAVRLGSVGSAGRVEMWRGDGPGGLIWRLTLEQLRDSMIESGLVSTGEIDRGLELCDDRRLSVMSQVVMAAWGRRR
jgi:ubiquinone/menaquinone biosynthesis C-methylase UbiE